MSFTQNYLQAHLLDPNFTKTLPPVKTCRNSSKPSSAFFTKATFSKNSLIDYSLNPLKSSSLAKALDCNCPDLYCDFYQLSEIACCPYDDPSGNTFIPYYENAPCGDPSGNCATPQRYAEPYYCADGSSPETSSSCYGYYLETCDPPPPDCGSTEICGNGIDDDCDGTVDEFCPPPPSGGGGGGGGGGYCTPYYWVYYISYDGGETWNYDYAEYAGCW